MEDYFIQEWLTDANDANISEMRIQEEQGNETGAGYGVGIQGCFTIERSSIEENKEEEEEEEEEDRINAGQFMFPAIPYWWWEILKNSIDINNFRCGNIRQFPEEKEGLETMIFEWSYLSKDFKALADLLYDICEYVDDTVDGQPNIKDDYIVYQGYALGGCIDASSVKNKKSKKYTIILSYTRKCPCCIYEYWFENNNSEH
jgi:hypothetical protein